MLRLSFPEVSHRFNLGHYRAWPEPGGVDIFNRAQRLLALGFVDVIDGRTIRFAAVVALPVLGARVMDLEEELQHFPVARHLAVEDDFDALGMGAMIAIRGIGHIAAGVANPG